MKNKLEYKMWGESNYFYVGHYEFTFTILGDEENCRETIKLLTLFELHVIFSTISCIYQFRYIN